MTKRNEGIYKRGNTWTAHIHWTDLHGTPQQHKRGGFPTRQEAVRYRTQFLADLHTGKRRGHSKIKLGDFLVQQWLPKRRDELKASTYASYESTIKAYVLPLIGGIRMDTVTPLRLEDYYRTLMNTGAKGKKLRAGQGLSAKTIQNIATILNRAYRDAIRWELASTNPVTVSLKPKREHFEQRHWETKLAGEFLRRVQDDRLAAVWQLLVTTGCRRGELLGLRWCDVDLDAATITIRRARVLAGRNVIIETPKSAKSRRTIAIDQRTTRSLRRWQTKQAEERLRIGPRWQDTDGHLVTEPDGTLPNPNTFLRRFKALAKQVGLPAIALHGVRHTYITSAFDANLDESVISDRAGHSDSRITRNVYRHTLKRKDAEAAEAVANAFYEGTA
jgi:integrase